MLRGPGKRRSSVAVAALRSAVAWSKAAWVSLALACLALASWLSRRIGLAHRRQRALAHLLDELGRAETAAVVGGAVNRAVARGLGNGRRPCFCVRAGDGEMMRQLVDPEADVWAEIEPARLLPLAQAMETGPAGAPGAPRELRRCFPVAAGVRLERRDCEGRVPIAAEGAVLGAIGIQGGRSRLRAGERLFLVSVADAAAAALARISLLTAERAASAELARSARDRDLIAGLTARLSRGVSLADVGSTFVEHALPALGAAAASIHLLDERRRDLVLVAAAGIDEETLGPWRVVRFDPSGTPVAAVVAERARRLLGTPEQIRAEWPALEPLRASLGHEAWAVLPLSEGERAIGAVTLSYDAPQAFDAAQVTLLERVAARVSEAIVRATLYEAEQRARAQAERAARRTARLNAVAAEIAAERDPDRLPATLIRLIHDAAGARQAFLYLLDEHEPVLRLAQYVSPRADLADRWRDLPLSGDLPLAEAVREGRSVLLPDRGSLVARFGEVIHDVDPRLEAALSMPLYGESGTVGGLWLGFDEPLEKPEEEEAFSTLLARQAALALERSALTRAERAAARRADRLRRLTSELASAVTPRDVAGAAVRQAVEAVRADAATLCTVKDGRVSVIAHHGDAGELGAGLMALAVGDAAPAAHSLVPDEPAFLGTAAALAERLAPCARPATIAAGAAAVLPLPASDGRVAGTLTVLFREERRFRADDRSLLSAIAEQAAQALDRARLYEAERDARLRAELLERHAAHLAAAATVADVARSTVLDLEGFGLDLAALWMLREGGTLEMEASTGMLPENVERVRVYSLETDEGVVSDAIRTRDLVVVDTGEQYDARYPGSAHDRRSHAVETVMGVPLRAADGEVVGVLFCASAQPRWLDERRRQLFAGIVEQTGLALERARLQAAEREARRRTEILQELASDLSAAVLPVDVAQATVPFLGEAFGADMSLIGLVSGGALKLLARGGAAEAGTRVPAVIPLDESSPAVEAVRTGAVVELHGRDQVAERYSPEVVRRFDELGLASMLVVPLGDGTGAVSIVFRRHRVLTAAERDLLDAIVHQLSQALERSRLLEREATRRRRAEALQALSERLSATADVDEVAEIAAESAHSAVGATSTLVARLEEQRDVLVLRHGTSTDPGVAGRWQEAPVSTPTPLTDAVRTRRPVIVDSLEACAATYPGIVDDLRAAGVESIAAVPMRTGEGRSIGTLAFTWTAAGSIDADVVDNMQLIADICVQALERAGLLREEEQARRRAELMTMILTELESVTGLELRAQRLVELLVPRVSDYASAERPGEAGRPVVALAHRDPSMLETLRALRLRHRLDEDDAPILPTTRHVTQLVSRVVPGSLDEWAHDAQTLALLEKLGPLSHMAVPITAGPTAIGVLVLGLTDPGRRPYTDRDVRFMQELMARVGLLFENARLQADEHETALKLQHALLPARLPDVPGLAAAGLYQAGHEHLDVGGDWYDVIDLGEGAIGLAVGDVVGHGIEAAAAMGRLRTALIAFALSNRDPADVLDRLERFAETVPFGEFATVGYGVLDPTARTLRYTLAGHPPPLLVAPGGDAVFLDEGRSVPLCGLGPTPRPVAEVEVPAGSTLVLYSDGLVERPRVQMDERLEALREAATVHADEPPFRLCRSLVDALGADGFRDDVAVLVVRTSQLAVRTFVRRFPARPAELSPLRAALRVWADAAGLPAATRQDILLGVGEACANAIGHAYPPGASGDIQLTLSLLEDGRVEIEVRDWGTWRPRSHPGERGRGISIMEALFDRVRINRDPTGTIVSMERMPGAGVTT